MVILTPEGQVGCRQGYENKLDMRFFHRPWREVDDGLDQDGVMQIMSYAFMMSFVGSF